jgi:flavin reductase (DIM6/NTAB) family NADH-FMN oxidoreductase RutF
MDVRTFWQAIGCRAVGAAVVTARDASGPAGFLALSATHLSADPPRIMVSIDAKTSALATIREARHFAVNYLSADQDELTKIFGGRTDLQGADRFTKGAWTTLSTGAPVLTDAVGVLDCTLEETIDRGAVIAIGRLVANSFSQNARPLISFRGGYIPLAT